MVVAYKYNQFSGKGFKLIQIQNTGRDSFIICIYKCDIKSPLKALLVPIIFSVRLPINRGHGWTAGLGWNTILSEYLLLAVLNKITCESSMPVIIRTSRCVQYRTGEKSGPSDL